MYSQIVSFLIMFASAPLWLPLARAMWRELDAGLAREGGLLGLRVPSAPGEGLESGSRAGAGLPPERRFGDRHAPAAAAPRSPIRLSTRRWR